ncbi:hypothetical protein J6590_057740 [Homalodisca vitripennis]|nr:hypothetical protein J6590_057740 [Homalodisca vitripennis]
MKYKKISEFPLAGTDVDRKATIEREAVNFVCETMTRPCGNYPHDPAVLEITNQP